MNDPLAIVALTLLAGLAIPLGGLIACFGRVQSRWLENEIRHTVIAFGGGALLSAVALVLVPEGSAELPMGLVALWMSLGGLSFLGLDIFLTKRKTPATQLAAMLSDFIPEALALGAACAMGKPSAALLAGLIAVQNLPEGFNAFRELAPNSPARSRRLLVIFALLALLGPVAGLIGFYGLASRPAVTGGIMLFASGGILYLIFQDLAPQAKLDRHWAPPLGAVGGFMLGLMGQLLLAPA